MLARRQIAVQYGKMKHTHTRIYIYFQSYGSNNLNTHQYTNAQHLLIKIPKDGSHSKLFCSPASSKGKAFPIVFTFPPTPNPKSCCFPPQSSYLSFLLCRLLQPQSFKVFLFPPFLRLQRNILDLVQQKNPHSITGKRQKKQVLFCLSQYTNKY